MRHNLFGKQRHAFRGHFKIHVARMEHGDKITEPADFFVKRSQLVGDIIRRAIDRDMVFAEIFHPLFANGICPPTAEAPREEIGIERGLDITWRRAVLGFRLVVGDVPEDPLDGFQGFLLGFTNGDQRHEGELTIGRTLQPLCLAPRPNTVEHRGQLVDRRQKHREGKSSRNSLTGMIQITAARRPDRRMRLLIRPRPHIDLTLVNPFAFVVERPVMGGPGFLDKINRFPKPLGRLGRITVRRKQFIRHTAHETALQPAIGNVIDHGHFLGAPDGIGKIGHRVAKDQYPRLLGLAGQDGKRHNTG